MGAMWSDEADEEEPIKSKRVKRGGKKTQQKSSFFDDFSFSDMDGSGSGSGSGSEDDEEEEYKAEKEKEKEREREQEEESVYEEPEPVYVAPIRKRAARSKTKSVRFAKAKKVSKRRGY